MLQNLNLMVVVKNALASLDECSRWIVYQFSCFLWLGFVDTGEAGGFVTVSNVAFRASKIIESWLQWFMVCIGDLELNYCRIFWNGIVMSAWRVILGRFSLSFIVVVLQVIIILMFPFFFHAFFFGKKFLILNISPEFLAKTIFFPTFLAKS